MTTQEERKILLSSSDNTEDEDECNATSLTNSKSDLPSPNDVRVIVIKDKKSRAMNRYSMPDDHLNLSMCACCMFCPIGVCAVMQSYQVQEYFEMGLLDKSRETSQNTLRLAKKGISIGCIIISCIMAFLLTIALILTALFKPNEYY